MISVLFSGGIDSWACLNWAIAQFGINEVETLFIAIGHSYEEKEYKVAYELSVRLLRKPPRVVNISGMLSEDAETAHIPLRNTLMLMMSALNEQCNGVVFGMLRGDSSEDKNKPYLRIMQKLFDSQFAKSIYRLDKREFRIYAPFADFTKTQLVKWCIDNTPDYGIDGTVGCYSSSSYPCGECMSCFNRWVARYSNGLRDENYLVHPFASMFRNALILKQIKKKTPTLFSISQLWMKRYWLIDSYTAMNHYSKINHKKGLLSLWIGLA